MDGEDVDKKKEIIGKISGKDLIKKASGKLSRNDGGVKSGTGYHTSDRDYNRKNKANQRLKKALKDHETSGFEE